MSRKSKGPQWLVFSGPRHGELVRVSKRRRSHVFIGILDANQGGLRYEFWRAVRPLVADPAKAIDLRPFPNETAYIASEWRGPADERLILPEEHH